MPTLKETLRTVLAPFPPAQSSFDSLVQTESDLTTTLRKIENSKNTSFAACALIQYLITILVVTGGDEKVAVTIISDGDMKNLGQVGKKYSYWSGWDSRLNAIIESMRQRLLQAESTGVLLAAIKSAKITLSTSLQTPICALLDDLIKTGTSLNCVDAAARMRALSNDANVDKALSMLNALRRLAAVVVDPTDFDPLLSGGYQSASEIAQTSAGRFSVLMEDQRMDHARAVDIYAHATAVDIRNEQSWIALIKSRCQHYTPAALPSQIAPSSNSSRQIAPDVDMISMFQLEKVDCESCRSITSPNAYLVELLQFLARSPASPMKSDGTIDNQTLAKTTLLEILRKRRPDIMQLNLSCENAEVPVSYLTLVNEVMESFVAYLGVSPAKDLSNSIQVYNTPPASSGKETVDNTILSVYQKQMASVMHPFPKFPYNQAVDSMQLLFNAASISWPKLVSLFWSSRFVLEQVQRPVVASDWDSNSFLCKYVQAANDRAQAACALNMSQEDFMLVTGECFWPEDGYEVLFGVTFADDMSKSLPSYSVGMLWGYEDGPGLKADDAMADDTKGLGLTYVRDQLLPRANINAKDLLALLNTRFLRGRLVLVPSKEGNVFDGSLTDMRLRASILNNSPGKLSTEQFRDMQAFLRLRHKLGWPIDVLDRAIGAAEDSLIRLGTKLVDAMNPAVLCELSAIATLSTLVGLSPAALLPLWSDIDTAGPRSTYNKLFLTGPTSHVQTCFNQIQNGYLIDAGKFKDHLTELMIVFGIRSVDIFTLLDVARLTIEHTLDLASISSFYRGLLFAQLLGIKVNNYPQLIALLQSPAEALQKPTKTLQSVQLLKAVIQDKFSISTAVKLLPNATAGQPEGTILLLSDVFDVGQMISPSAIARQPPSEENIAASAHELFQGENAARVLEVISGTQACSVPIDDNLANALTAKSAAHSLPAVLSVQNTSTRGYRLQFAGVMSDVQKASLISQLSDVAGIQTLIEDLKLQSNLTFNEIIAPLIAELPSSEAETISKVLIPPIVISTDEISALQSLLERRRAFMTLATFQRAAIRAQQLAFQAAKAMFPSLTDDVIHSVLLNARFQGDTDQPQQKSLSLAQLPSMVASSSQGNMIQAAYVIPSPGTAGGFSFKVTLDPNTAPVLSIDGVSITPTQQGTSAVFTNASGSANKIYLVRSNFDLRRIEILASDGKRNWNDSPSLSLDNWTRIQQANVTMTRSLGLCQGFQLNAEELNFFFNGTHSMSMHFESLSLKDMRQLRAYGDLRSQTQSIPYDLLQLLTWLVTSESTTSMSEVVSAITKWMNCPAALIQSIFQSKYDSRITALWHFQKDALQQLHDIADIVNLTKRYSDLGTDAALTALFKGMTPRKPFDWTIASTSAQKISMILKPALSTSQHEFYDAASQKSQRDALVSYLVQQDFFRRDRRITDGDGLMDYFLIDVEMGPELKTSRSKQAISSVHIFVSRCLMGLESGQGVNPTDINADAWAWMSRHDVWAANRKLVLYPENWIDPMLRDDKSQVFQAFEAAILQGDLTDASAISAYRNYISGLNEISDLDILSYVREFKPKDCFHFFARTKTLPPQSYYRQMNFVGESKDIFWLPWTKIDLDIPAPENDWDGSTLTGRGSYLIPVIRQSRIYLFVPQISLKTLPMDTSGKVYIPEVKQGEKVVQKARQDDLTMELIAKRPAKDNASIKLWEIKMAWSECVAGQWSPRKFSRSVLQVKATDHPDNILPSLGHFQFCVSNQTEIIVDRLSLDVTCWYGDGVHRTVGKFDLRHDRVTAVSPPKNANANLDKNHKALCTEFSRLTTTSEGNDTIGSMQSRSFGPNVLTPLLALPTVVSQGPARLTFTLSYNESEPLTIMRLCGLVVDVDDQKKPGETQFVYSRAGFSCNSTSSQILTHSTVENLGYTLAPELMQTLTNADPISDILGLIYKPRAPNAALSGEALKKAIKDLKIEDAKEKDSKFGGYNGASKHELASPWALYNWEIGVHCLMMIAERFFVSRQYESALRFLKLLYNPSSGGQKKSDCWSFQVFKDIADDAAETTETVLKNLQLRQSDVAVTERQQGPSSPHGAARARPVAYMKRIMSTYVAVLIAYGDEYFRRGTWEALPLALQRYIEAKHVLGPDPPDRPTLGTHEPLTYDTIKQGMIDMELEFPFLRELGQKTTGNPSAAPDAILGIVRTSYFCVPLNPELLKQRAVLKDRLWKIRSSLDIDGNPVSYALVDPDRDPGSLLNLTSRDVLNAKGGFLAQSGPMPTYRFKFMLQRALELASEVRSIGDQYLTMREKHDVESLLAIRAQHDVRIQSMMLEIKKMGQQDIGKTIESLKFSRDGLVHRLSTVLNMLGEPLDRIPQPNQSWQDFEIVVPKPSPDGLRLTTYEQNEIAFAGAGELLNLMAGEMDLTAAGLSLLPNMMENVEPMGIGMSFKFDGSNMSQSLSLTSTYTKLQAQICYERSAKSARKLQFIRQLQERQEQANALGTEIVNMDYQISIQTKRLEMNQKEQELQKQQAADALELETWYRSKFTNEKLYGWAENTLRALHKNIFEMAMSMARQVEATFAFERGEPSSTMVTSLVSWNPQYDGILAGQQLYYALKKVEQTYRDQPVHDFEMIKSFSLRNIDPYALILLRETGNTSFSLPELLYDFDFPGHYMRRIQSIYLTMPCLVGPFTSVAATLTLTSHQYRVNGLATDAKEYNKDSGTGPDFRADRVAISAVAISNGQNDNGLLNLDFRDEKYLPFEGAGATSTWRIELPTEIRQFDYQSIGDVVLHMRYTARNGGSLLRKAANESVAALRTGQTQMAETWSVQALVDVACDYPEGWYKFQKDVQGGRPSTVALDRVSHCLPFWARALDLEAQAVSVVISPQSDNWHSRLKFSVQDGMDWTSSKLGQESTLLEVHNTNTNTSMDDWSLSYDMKTGQNVQQLERLLIVVRLKIKAPGKV